ncbi:pyocin immunity protein [Photorhabdus laumondii subsp. laumondii]|uniref:Photorhabdus luminescens subsp. laumondii TTO1 complete genome segment 15/17 n=2 Tax=Photorhabdus laumondii subsp. laumondii TaxID=141679 RepID=Q7MZU9_PHOLL|nr:MULTISPECIES: DUF6392 family protein [Photorhabdus]AWK43747.1 pyocin immunity protein [Photorhabdus laumondii subsp. laumondii]AXG44422.1 pyocin immunity protein [Photorhabdus laumondii subsp. laumondii]AXG49056.1 pyocin immunity protein [Photorhabdus laumondii subsp. laumondii]KTL60471.1 pyocin immunity protein [Photorhabdus laumondii subsp. laumondii]MCC8384988.1 pyocin immunity protein [Photorhabdus laumondii]
MTINVEALINSLGETYQEIFDEGLIPYKTKPTGSSGDEVIFLDMVKEGVFLAFYRDGKRLKEITLTLLDEKKPLYQFPNKLPSPLVPLMSRQWVHEQFGEPKKSQQPQMVMKRQFGWKELYTLLDFHIPTSMKISYDMMERVKSVTFLLTSEVRW